nr:vegetative cell wall protein gp1-like [Aegilops tauschii subsp. strangulata]
MGFLRYSISDTGRCFVMIFAGMAAPADPISPPDAVVALPPDAVVTTTPTSPSSRHLARSRPIALDLAAPSPDRPSSPDVPVLLPEPRCPVPPYGPAVRPPASLPLSFPSPFGHCGHCRRSCARRHAPRAASCGRHAPTAPDVRTPRLRSPLPDPAPPRHPPAPSRACPLPPPQPRLRHSGRPCLRRGSKPPALKSPA